LDDIEAIATAAGVGCATKHLRTLSPADAIVACADSEHCDLIVIGSHGRGTIRQLLLGSVTTRALALCKVPVLAHR
jgi:nucleotide-binding universal stress UspA family protein